MKILKNAFDKKNDGHIDKEIWDDCHHLLLVYDASKLSTVYIVKSPVLQKS